MDTLVNISVNMTVYSYYYEYVAKYNIYFWNVVKYQYKVYKNTHHVNLLNSWV